jgi:hypothetical protein
MSQYHGLGTGTLLRDGRVLIAGGFGSGTSSASAELYDPATGTFSPTGSMHVPRDQQTATLLGNGRVLVAGGEDAAINGPAGNHASAELYDPTTGKFSPTGSMRVGRVGATATLLRSGKVLIAGGIAAGVRFHAVASAEIYDPASGRFSPTGSMSVARSEFTATLLQDGRVLIVGGDNDGPPAYAIAETYDPGTGKFSRTGSLVVAREDHSATLLADGRVFVAGGSLSCGVAPVGCPVPTPTTEIYNPATGKFTPAAPLSQAPRYFFSANLLGDGRVLVAFDGGAEFFDPETGQMSAWALTPGNWDSATTLQDGRVLLWGDRSLAAGLYEP